MASFLPPISREISWTTNFWDTIPVQFTIVETEALTFCISFCARCHLKLANLTQKGMWAISFSVGHLDKTGNVQDIYAY